MLNIFFYVLPCSWRYKLFVFIFSVLTDIDINSYDDSTLGTPSLTSYRMNQDVLCVQPPSLRAQGSFRSTRDTANSSTKRNISNVPDSQCQFIRFRGRNFAVAHFRRCGDLTININTSRYLNIVNSCQHNLNCLLSLSRAHIASIIYFDS